MFAVSGSIVALVTPMTIDGSIDWAALDRLVDWHVQQGSQGIVAVGTTGESATLEVDEHCQVIERIVARAGGRIAVLAGTGANATREALQLTRSAAAAGADACLLVTPYYNKPTQEGLYQHYRTIAEAVEIPQILYNVPSRTACDLLPETVLRLAEMPNLAGIKEATGDTRRAAEIIGSCGTDFALYSGDDPTCAETMLLGGRGVISVTANAAPAAMAELCAAALAGDAQRTRTLNGRLADLHRALFLESNPIPVKWALAEMGLIASGLRLPLTPLSSAHHGALHRALRKAGALQPDGAAPAATM